MIGNGSEGMEEEREIDIFVTNKCNSNCIMCPMSEGSRRKNNPEHIEELKAYIRELPKDVEYINVTGGEPTLAVPLSEEFGYAAHTWLHAPSTPYHSGAGRVQANQIS